MKSYINSTFWFLLPLLLVTTGSAIDGEEEPLSITVVAQSSWGSNTFTRGAPIDISVFISNNLIRQNRQLKTVKERASRQQAEKNGLTALPGLAEVQDTSDLSIRIADNASGFFSGISIQLIRSDSLTGNETIRADWSSLVLVKSFTPEKPVIVGKYPVWITFELPPDRSSALKPGSYFLTVSLPRAGPASDSFRISDAASEAEQAMFDFELAEYFLRQKEYEKAVDHAVKSLHKLTIEHDMLYLTLGDAYAGLKESEKAVDAYEKFLKTYENSKGWAYPSVVRQTVNQLKQEINSGKEK